MDLTRPKIVLQTVVPMKFGVGGGNNANKWIVLDEEYQQPHSLLPPRECTGGLIKQKANERKHFRW
jgi:hypothetical protein